MRTCDGLVGREAAVRTAVRLVREHRTVTITGPGGVGKSAVAAEAARRLRTEGGERGARSTGTPPEPWDVIGRAELDHVQDPALLPHALARALRTEGDPSLPQLTALARALGDRRVLLVADTCETAAPACAEAFAALHAACPRLYTVATSRTPVATGAELQLAPLTAAETARTFEAYAPGEGQLALHIGPLLDGLPLAARIAAGRLARVGPGGLLAGAVDPDALLDLPAPRAGLPARQRTLRGSLDWSLRLCTPGERLLWARCSVFPGAFTAADARRVCGDARLPESGIGVALAELADRSLLLETSGGLRVSRLGRAYGRRILARLGEERELLARCLDWLMARG